MAILFPASGALFLIGYVLFSVDLLRTGQLGRAAPIAMIVGVVVFGVGLSGFLPMIVVQVGAVLFGAATMWMGIRLIAALRQIS